MVFMRKVYVVRSRNGISGKAEAIVWRRESLGRLERGSMRCLQIRI
jgi:hypothetical protein